MVGEKKVNQTNILFAIECEFEDDVDDDDGDDNDDNDDNDDDDFVDDDDDDDGINTG